MMDDSRKKIKNAQGLRNLEQTRLAYSHEILANLAENPSLVDDLIEDLGITDSELFDNLSGATKGNITFYDQSLSSIRVLSKSKESNISNRARK